MTTSQQHPPLRGGREREDEFWRNPLPHLSTCLAASAIVILVILAIHWLT